MLTLDVSESMKSTIESLVEKCRSNTNVYNITATFTSPTQPDLRVELCREIDQITIDQNFTENYSDKILMELTLDMNEYVTMYYMRKDMVCEVKLATVHPDKNEPTQTKPEYEALTEDTLKFDAVIIKYEDIFKKIAGDKLYPEYNDKRDETETDRATYKMTVELIDDTVFMSRKVQANDIFYDVTMEDVLRYTASKFGFTYAHIVPPDNDRVYLNFVIPPNYGVESIMGFYQNAAGLGVYNNGFCSYITRWWKDLQNVCWYVYPRYGKPGSDNPIHVYHPGGNMYLGMTCNHAKMSGISILCTDELIMKNWSDIGTENGFSGICAQLSEAVLEKSRVLVADEKVKANKVISEYGIVPSDPMSKKEFIKVDHRQSNGNVFKIKSEIRAFQGSSITFTWHNAKPWTFTPSTMVYIHYDHPLGFKQVFGMCERAIYTIKRDENQPLNPIWISTGVITVYIDNTQEENKSHV